MIAMPPVQVNRYRPGVSTNAYGVPIAEKIGALELLRPLKLLSTLKRAKALEISRHRLSVDQLAGQGSRKLIIEIVVFFLAVFIVFEAARSKVNRAPEATAKPLALAKKAKRIGRGPLGEPMTHEERSARFSKLSPVEQANIDFEARPELL
ncbi:MAG TPA: hypothetical protein VK457_11440 [Chloroflexota bacterium]|nr:hypothetical protein [Chloroflexota bacterium]